MQPEQRNIQKPSLVTHGEEEVEEVGQRQRGQAEQPQQNCEGCQTLPLELSQAKDLEAQHNACVKAPHFVCQKQQEMKVLTGFELRHKSIQTQKLRVQCSSQNDIPLDAEVTLLLYTGNMLNMAQLPSRQRIMIEARGW